MRENSVEPVPGNLGLGLVRRDIPGTYLEDQIIWHPFHSRHPKRAVNLPDLNDHIDGVEYLLSIWPASGNGDANLRVIES